MYLPCPKCSEECTMWISAERDGDIKCSECDEAFTLDDVEKRARMWCKAATAIKAFQTACAAIETDSEQTTTA